MKFVYQPKTNLEKFGTKVQNLLVENFSQTFFVGGMVRDLLLGKKVTDIDIATEALPEQVVELLKKNSINIDDKNKRFGSVIAKQGKMQIEITTFRKDLKATSRYPQVVFIKSPKIDSKRRDFTINSLYLSPFKQNIQDYQNGLKDIKLKQIRFIGDPEKRIQEDPLRIIRAIRFSLVLGFRMDKKTLRSIKNNFSLIGTLTRTRLQTEITKIKNPRLQNNLKNILNDPKLLDNRFE